MANVNLYPIADVTEMAETTGFNMSEIANWTQELLDSTMGLYYAGTLTPVVNPGQGTRPPDEVFRETFISGVTHDVSEIGIAFGEAARALGSAPGKALQAAKDFGKLIPLLVVGGIALAVLIVPRLVRK